MNGLFGNGKIILTPAHIEICPVCAFHGSIVLSDGLHDCQVGSLRDFDTRMVDLFRKKKLVKEELIVLQSQIIKLELAGKMKRFLTPTDITETLGKLTKLSNEAHDPGKIARCVEYLEIFREFAT